MTRFARRAAFVLSGLSLAVLAACGGGGGGGSSSTTPPPAALDKTSVNDAADDTSVAASDASGDAVRTVLDTSGGGFKASEDALPEGTLGKTACTTITVDAGSTSAAGGFTVDFGTGCAVTANITLSGSVHASYTVITPQRAGTLTFLYNNLGVTRNGVTRTRNGTIQLVVASVTSTLFTVDATYTDFTVAGPVRTVTVNGSLTSQVTLDAVTRRAVTVVINSPGTPLQVVGSIRGAMQVTFTNVEVDIVLGDPCPYQSGGTITVTDGIATAVVTLNGCRIPPVWALNGVIMGQLTE